MGRRAGGERKPEGVWTRCQYRWFAEYSVGIYNREAPPPLLGSRRKPIDLHAYLAVIVCSPAFKANPPGPDEAREDLAQAPNVPTENAIVQESFSEEAVTQYLEEKLEQIHASSLEDLKNQLAAFMVVR